MTRLQKFSTFVFVLFLGALLVWASFQRTSATQTVARSTGIDTNSSPTVAVGSNSSRLSEKLNHTSEKALKDTDVEHLAPDALLSIIANKDYSPVSRNNAANLLLNQHDPRLSTEIMRMLKDESETVIWRNYCVQFLKGCYSQTPDPDVITAISNACNNASPTISSCAIWSLAQLATPRDEPTHLSEEDLKQLRYTARTALKSEQVLLRIGGVQSCARLGMNEVLPVIRLMAENESDISLRTVAIASLGQLHDSESNALLKKLTFDSNYRIQKAADMALKQLASNPERQ